MSTAARLPPVAIPDGLRALLTAPGPSGYETAAAAAFRGVAEGIGAEVASDVMGSSMARVRGTGGGPTVAVIGHVDEIGLIVTHIEDGGFLRFDQLGGWDPVVLPGQRVEILGRDGIVPGVIARKPVHLLKPDDRKQAPELRQLHIDIGADDGDEARERVRIGDAAVLAAEPLELPHGRFAARALDNRLGCWVALEVARLVAEAGDAPGDVVAVGAVQEELLPRLSGATAVAYDVQPDIAIVVDVTWETGQPGVELGETSKQEFGGGGVITRGAQLHPAVTDGLIAVGDAEGIPYVVAASGRGTFTDADSVYLVRAGLPTGLVSIPTRHLHSPVEMAQLSDVEATAALIAAYVRRLEPGVSFAR